MRQISFKSHFRGFRLDEGKQIKMIALGGTQQNIWKQIFSWSFFSCQLDGKNIKLLAPRSNLLKFTYDFVGCLERRGKSFLLYHHKSLRLDVAGWMILVHDDE
jgi:hypothetical protein